MAGTASRTQRVARLMGASGGADARANEDPWGRRERTAEAWSLAIGEARIARAARPLSDHWMRTAVARRDETLLGVSFRPLQAEAMGLDAAQTLRRLLAYPFQLIRLGAYWNRIEVAPGTWRFEELDAQVAEAEQAGKRIILNTGALKTFGYPEFFAPARYLSPSLPERALVRPETRRPLLDAATAFVTRVIERYRDRSAIVAWQVEHEAVDPLGMEHSWRLAASFVGAEVAAARSADSTRPILMNGFLPTSLPVRAQQWWRTRDQGDSLAVARQLADVVGIDYYPRHALFAIGARTVYLDGSGAGDGTWGRRAARAWAAWAAAAVNNAGARQRRVMITEGQSEPWEAVTIPPNPSPKSGGSGAARYGATSCLPNHVIENYNQAMRWARSGGLSLYAYLFWGAEYWLLREQSGDPSYLGAFMRLLDQA